MAREEDIIQAGIEYTIKNRPICIAGAAFSELADELNRNHDFEKCAKWADETMIEKACKWLDVNFPTIDSVGSWYKESFIKQFKKAMEK